MRRSSSQGMVRSDMTSGGDVVIRGAQGMFPLRRKAWRNNGPKTLPRVVIFLALVPQTNINPI